jgi:cysteinyl-tRNA synthetase
LLDQAYTPMTIRFYMLQAHYRSTLDFSNEALVSAEKAYLKLLSSYHELDMVRPAQGSGADAESLYKSALEALNDDLNTAVVLANLFEASRMINAARAGSGQLHAEDLASLRRLFDDFLFGILGMEKGSGSNGAEVEGLMNLVLSIRAEAKTKKDFAVSDKIREALTQLNFVIKDGKDGATWSRG